MLRQVRALGFFTSIAAREYAANSPRHMQLQAEFSKQAERWRATITQLNNLPNVQKLILDIREYLAKYAKHYPQDSVLANHVKEADDTLKFLNDKKADLATSKLQISMEMRKLLAGIKEECAQPVIHAVELPKHR